MRAPTEPQEQPQQLLFDSDDMIPNSPLPVLIYRQVELDGDLAAAFERVFAANGWPPQWRDGIFDYHHYHSNAHEALGVAAGSAHVMLGGEHGQALHLQAGDLVILPAGTGHCRLEQSDDFLVVGAYPVGQEDYDIQRADASTLAASLERIARVETPQADPLLGSQGALARAWGSRA
ncbi:hypothetical protein ACX0MV_12950 [Pseudomonas borbori]